MSFQVFFLSVIRELTEGRARSNYFFNLRASWHCKFEQLIQGPIPLISSGISTKNALRNRTACSRIFISPDSVTSSSALSHNYSFPLYVSSGKTMLNMKLLSPSHNNHSKLSFQASLSTPAAYLDLQGLSKERLGQFHCSHLPGLIRSLPAQQGFSMPCSVWPRKKSTDRGRQQPESPFHLDKP